LTLTYHFESNFNLLVLKISHLILTNNNNNDNKEIQTARNQLEDLLQHKELSYIMEVGKINEQRSKYLAKKNQFKIAFEDGKDETFTRKPLSAKKNREIDELRSNFTGGTKNIKVNGKTYPDGNAVLHECYKKTAEYCLGLTADQYDSAIWEDFPEYMDRDIYGLQSILISCWMRSIHGVAYFPQASKTS